MGDTTIAQGAYFRKNEEQVGGETGGFAHDVKVCFCAIQVSKSGGPGAPKCCKKTSEEQKQVLRFPPQQAKIACREPRPSA
jgi:hypothetical protein